MQIIEYNYRTQKLDNSARSGYPSLYNRVTIKLYTIDGWAAEIIRRCYLLRKRQSSKP